MAAFAKAGIASKQQLEVLSIPRDLITRNQNLEGSRVSELSQISKDTRAILKEKCP